VAYYVNLTKGKKINFARLKMKKGKINYKNIFTLFYIF
jgi:hypothetical protein